MAFRPVKRKVPLDPSDRDEFRASKCQATPERIAAQLVNFHIDSRNPQAEPILFQDLYTVTPPSSCVSAASGQCGLGAGQRRQPVAAAERSCRARAMGRNPWLCKKSAAPMDELPTRCSSYVTTIEDCTDDSDNEQLTSSSSCENVVELSSELIRGMDAAEQLNSKFQDKLYQSVAEPLCTQVIVYTPREDFVRKVLDDASKASPGGPTIMEVPDDIDVSKMTVVRGGVVMDPDDDYIGTPPTTTPSYFDESCEEMDMG